MSAHTDLIAAAVSGGLALIVGPVAVRILIKAARAEAGPAVWRSVWFEPPPPGSVTTIGEHVHLAGDPACRGCGYLVPLPPLPADVAGQLVYLAPAAERRAPDDRIYLPTTPGTRMEIDTGGHVSFHEPEAGQ